jgi:HSP20 family protein
MLALWNQFDDLFNDQHSTIRRPTRSFVPAVDIEETKDGYLLTADLPGLTAEDVNITVENGVLLLSGERRDERIDEKEGYKRIERSFGSFRRSFTLPKGVDVEQVTAKTEHGQVKVRIPKPVAELPRKIKVESADPVVQ